MLPRHSHTHNTVKAHVTVSDLIGVQRVLTLLTGRRYVVTRFDAEEVGDGRWRMTLDLTAGPDEADVLGARLHRIPSVLDVDVQPGGVLGATA
jgi:hypothetical protein